MEIEGKVVLVTGGARRIGRAVVLGLAQRGAVPAIHYRSSAGAARALVQELRRRGIGARAFRADLASARGPEELARRVETRLGPVAALVNSASVYEATPLENFAVRDWDRVLATNLRGPVLLARRLGLAMKARASGVIINLGDWSIPRPYAGYAAYAASKAALEAVTRVMARELAPQVRVNMVSPGAILPPEGASPKAIRAMARAAALGRLGDPRDIAEAVLFLIERAPYTTGIDLVIDGGRGLS